MVYPPELSAGFSEPLRNSTQDWSKIDFLKWPVCKGSHSTEFHATQYAFPRVLYNFLLGG